MCEHPEANLHLDDDMLNEYLDRALSVEQALRFDAHLDGCEACMQRLEALRHIFEALEALPDIPLERDIAPLVIQVIYRQGGIALNWWAIRFASVLQALATISLLLVAWPFASGWVADAWSAYSSAGISDLLVTYFQSSVNTLLDNWSLTWHQLRLVIQDVLIWGMTLWEKLARPPVGPQISILWVAFLVIAASALWLLGNGLLLRLDDDRGYSSILNGGRNYD